jgi:hypothetical protein
VPTPLDSDLALVRQSGAPLPVLARIAEALGVDPSDWDYVFFLTTPNAYLGGDKPLDRLDDTGLEDELVRIAHRHAHPAEPF